MALFKKPAAIDTPVDELLDLDPVQRVQVCAELMDEHRDAISRLSEIRAQAVLEARSAGASSRELAEQLGVSRQQIHRLLPDGDIEEEPETVADLIELAVARGWQLDDSHRSHLKFRCSDGNHLVFVSRNATPGRNYFARVAAMMHGGAPEGADDA